MFTAQRRLSPAELVEAAVLAPSPDNNQPWRFTSKGEELWVYLDQTRTLPSDVNHMFDFIGVGAAIENACIAARQTGYRPDVHYQDSLPDAARDDANRLAARITFTPGARPDPLFSHLAARCTCRKPYSTRAIREQSLAAIAEAAAEFAEVQLDWITDRLGIRAFARLIAASDLIRFEYEPFHNEIFRQLRFSAEEIEQTRDGLDVRTLELPPGAAGMLRQLRPWNRMKWLHRIGLGRLFMLPSFLSVWRSGAIGLLSVPEPAGKCFLRSGQAFQRIWLAAQCEGLALQPLGSLPIFVAHVEQLEGQRLSPRHQRLVRKLIPRYKELLPAAGHRVPVIFFRIGDAPPPRFRSLRRRPEAVLDNTTDPTAEEGL